MLIDSEKIKQTKEQIEVMQAFTDGKEIEFKPDLHKGTWKTSTTPTWDFSKYKYRIKHSEPEYNYPIYKKSKDYGTIIKFTDLQKGTYLTKTTSYEIGDVNETLVEHTRTDFWEDYILEQHQYNYPLIKKHKHSEKIVSFTDLSSGSIIYDKDGKHNPGEKQSNSLTIHTDTEVWEDAEDTIIELFECIDYSPFWDYYSILDRLYQQSEIDESENLTKTGRKFIIDDKTKQLLKVIN